MQLIQPSNYVRGADPDGALGCANLDGTLGGAESDGALCFAALLDKTQHHQESHAD
ncbi:hypothetical protein SESBI_42792 [Sesbania bispinosa]|nr:hypothetical protein SESBI_42792 [Sesbania bispinosa]